MSRFQGIFGVLTVILFNVIMFSASLESPNQCDFQNKPKLFERSVSAFWKGLVGAEKITEINSDNYGNFMQVNHRVLIMYYTPWCGTSRRVRAKYTELAMNPEASELFNFAAIDCESQRELCEKPHRSISGVPTFLVFFNEKFVTDISEEVFQESPQDLVILFENIIRFMKEHSHNKSATTSVESTVLAQDKNEDSFHHSSSASVVLFRGFIVFLLAHLIQIAFS